MVVWPWHSMCVIYKEMKFTLNAKALEILDLNNMKVIHYEIVPVFPSVFAENTI